MITKDQDDVLKRAITQNGAERQAEMVNEEIGELLQVMNKMQRKGLLLKNGYKRPYPEMKPADCLLFFSLCSEIADVKLLLRQLEHMVGAVGQEAVQITIDRKITRLEERLNKNSQ